ncbi:MAG: hypothetical protein LBU90_07540 [Bacteroidales bacterium]|jgi:hypothetical protein|nr:hypothetical protein [Bacteroidales bacterium]
MKYIRLDIFLLITVVLLAGCIGFFRGLIGKSRENARLKNNIEALTSDCLYFVSKDGKNAAEVKSLTLTVSELKAHNAQLAQELATLKIKPKHVHTMAQVSTGAHYTLTLTRDSTVFDTITATRYHYANEWIIINALCSGDTCDTEIVTRDSLLVVHHTRVRRFLCFTWNTYSGKTTIKNYNPYSAIQQITSITLKH